MDISISQGGLTATIRRHGAELISLKNAAGREFLWEGNPQYWGKHSPVLFPIVGTLKNNAYRHEGQTYSLTRHGFARDRAFSLEKSEGNSAVFLLKSDDGTLAQYPFTFEFRLVYNLGDEGLSIGYEVRNTADKALYFSLGAHPAFALPLAFNAYSLKLDTAEELSCSLLENDLISAQTRKIPVENGQLHLDYGLFANDALIFKNVPFKKVTILENGQPLLDVRFDAFPDLGLWTKPDAPFLCIEPWYGYSDATDSNGELSEKPGIIALAPHENFTTHFSIQPLS